jgi:NAD(P)-dependent dehydrogenase (short-subunit alcohol dehydrogenase family)
MSLFAIVKGKGPSGFGYGSTAEEVTKGLDLGGRTFLVTGSNSGLGLETVRVLALRGARVIAAARTVEKARAAGLGREIVPIACELSDPASVRACVEKVKADGAALDAIICNAGIMGLPKLQQAHGYELQFFTNHIGHFILTTGLLDRLADGGRVVVVSSSAHNFAPEAGIEFDNLSGERSYGAWRAYGQSKLANLLFAKELARRLQGAGKTANAVHPGVILTTNLSRDVPSPLMLVARSAASLFTKTIAQGAATPCFVAAHPSLQKTSGAYFVDCNIGQSSARSHDAALAQRLWEESERIVAKL